MKTDDSHVLNNPFSVDESMSRFYDLHIHSWHSSDADFAPRHLFEMAQKTKIAGLSFSDHDTLAGIKEGNRLAQEFSLDFIPNVEISTYYKSRQFHLLAPLIDYQSPELIARLQILTEARVIQARARIKKLRELGFEITFGEVVKETGHKVPMGPAIAKVLLAKKSPKVTLYTTGEKATNGIIAFYKDFFSEGKPAHVKVEELETLEALRLIKNCRGVPVLAHPGAQGYKADEDIMETFVRNGLEGIEAYSSYHNPESVQQFLDWAKNWNLVPTAGSDFHGKVKPHVSFGSIRKRGREMVEELLERQN